MEPRGSILIVDDEFGPRESLRIILRRTYDVQVATHGEQALHFLSGKTFDLLTLDLKMPGLSGIDVLREIRRLNLNVDIIVISGYGTTTNVLESIRLGAVDFICKPFNVFEITSTIQKSLERRGYHQKIKNLIQQIAEFRRLGKDIEEEDLARLTAGADFLADVDQFQKETRESLHKMGCLRERKRSVNYMDFLQAVFANLEKKEPYPAGHSRRVSRYSGLLTQALDLSPEEKEALPIAAFFHDIGKLGPQARPRENNRLINSEVLYLRQHPIKAIHLLEPMAFSSSVTSAILHHHERWDGKGYPDGLAREEIPLLARIISLADFFDTLTSGSPGAPILSLQQAQEEIEKNAESQFDPVMVGLFGKHLQNGRILSSVD